MTPDLTFYTHYTFYIVIQLLLDVNIKPSMKNAQQWTDKPEDGLVRLWFGPEAIIGVYRFEYVDSILKNSTTLINKAWFYEAYVKQFGDGLLVA